MRFAPTITASYLLWLAPGLCFAEEPATALVMAISGKTTPAITAMSEIRSGVPVRLAPDAELTLLDYTRCKMVTVSGGTMTVTRTNFETDGKIVAETDAPCPRIHRLSASAGGRVFGGLVMRGRGNAPRWPLNREIVLAGDSSDRLAAAAIYAEGRLDAPLVQLDLSGHRAQFPAVSAPVAVDERYVLRLTVRDRATPVDISFIAAPPSGHSLLIVLRE